MADFQPFQGVLYNSAAIKKLEEVIAPPYDVISPKEQEEYYQLHPNNVIRLILGKSKPTDNGHHNVYTRSADYLNRWLNEKILIRDERPGFYLTSVTFQMGGETVTRYGITGVVRLEPFEKGIVLPHERTFSKVKSEQLQLIKACQANFNPIFSIYSDTSGLLQRLRQKIEDISPIFNLMDRQGLQHKMWRINDADTVNFVTNSLEMQRIYIADGHHRYETALNYCQWKKDNDPNFSPNDPANFVLMKLISMEDPGLIILPAHRLLKQVSQDAAESMMDRAKDFFDIYTFPFRNNLDETLNEAAALQSSRAADHAIGVFLRSKPSVFVFVLKPGTMERLLGNEMPASLLDVDVTVLTRLLMVELLDFDQNRLDDETKIDYRTSMRDAIETVIAGQADISFILNPTTIDQVKRVSEEGLIMPRKSTYFFPKLISGQVMNLLR